MFHRIIFLLLILSFSNYITPAQIKPDHFQQQNMRRWIEALAVNTAAGLPSRWPEIFRDCAGYIRFLIWESTQSHSVDWNIKFGSAITRDLEDVKIKGSRVWKTSSGVWNDYSDAESLMKYNSRFLGKKINESGLRTGDILFFKLARGSAYEYHSMIVIREHIKGRILIFYHNGEKPGEIRSATLAELSHHPDSTWHPISSNPEFIGFYRLYFFQD